MTTSAPAADAKPAGPPDGRPVMLYSLRYHAPGERRHLPDSDYRQALEVLVRDFDVRVSDAPVTSATLNDVTVLFIAATHANAIADNPPPRHVTQEDMDAITAFVEDGGGLLFFAGPEDDNTERKQSNRLLSRFGVLAGRPTIGAKALTLSPTLPLLGGLRWAAYGMPPLDFIDAATETPPAVVMNDLEQRPLRPQDRDYAGAVMIRQRHGRGRVAIVAGAAWAADWAMDGTGKEGVAVREQDNREILRRLARWTAARAEPDAPSNAPR